MNNSFLIFLFLTLMCTDASEFYFPHNTSRTTLSGIAEYRSALTLDWLAAEDSRQRELALAFETESAAPLQVVVSDCISYSKPASGKVARLMLELLKNLEGDEGTIITELIQSLMKSKLLVETSMLDAEPSLDSLVKTPDVMMGEPHITFPRILAMIWMTATDPMTVKKNGWCTINRVAKYLGATRSALIASHMRNIDPVVARARFIMEDFIQHVTPNMYEKNIKNQHRTSSMKEQRLASRTSFPVHGRPSWKGFSPTYRNQKMTMNSSTTDAYIASLAVTSFGKHEHVLVDMPTFEDEKNQADVFRISVRLFCDCMLMFLVFYL